MHTTTSQKVFQLLELTQLTPLKPALSALTGRTRPAACTKQLPSHVTARADPTAINATRERAIDATRPNHVGETTQVLSPRAAGLGGPSRAVWQLWQLESTPVDPNHLSLSNSEDKLSSLFSRTMRFWRWVPHVTYDTQFHAQP